MRHIFLCSVILLWVTSCTRVSKEIEPIVPTPLHPKEISCGKIETLCSPTHFEANFFAPLSESEKCTDWGKELQIALSFAEDFDLYRAITTFKRALFLLPIEETARRLEIQYYITLSYFLGHKYEEVTCFVETSQLLYADDHFPAFNDLLLLLFESYSMLGKQDQACYILSLIEMRDFGRAEKLSLLRAVRRADFASIQQFAKYEPEFNYLTEILYDYSALSKSVRKAQILNAILPGSGYWYVGLKQTAITAFSVNALFLTAAAYFFCNHNWAAGAITLSLESGWYFGGITGAGLAAKTYNEQLYCSFAKKIGEKECYFPILMLNYSF